MAPTINRHIRIDENGVAWLEGTTTKVMEVVLAKLAAGRTVEQLHDDHPHWSLAQIHAALAFYYDNKVEFDAQIEAGDREYERLRAASDQPARKEWEERFRHRRAASSGSSRLPQEAIV